MKKSSIDYRQLKKMLNPYVSFSFETPRKGRDFTPQQKSAITRQFNKVGGFLVQLQNENATFIRGQKVPGAVQTKKGSFIPYANAKVKKNKKGKIELVKTQFGKRREVYLPFPSNIKTDMDKIKNYVEKYRQKLRPDYIRWATKGQIASEVYKPDSYTLYGAEFFAIEAKGHKDANLVGVYMGWRPGGADFLVKRPARDK